MEAFTQSSSRRTGSLTSGSADLRAMATSAGLSRRGDGGSLAKRRGVRKEVRRQRGEASRSRESSGRKREPSRCGSAANWSRMSQLASPRRDMRIGTAYRQCLPCALRLLCAIVCRCRRQGCQRRPLRGKEQLVGWLV